jgi:hypothetical protein
MKKRARTGDKVRLDDDSYAMVIVQGTREMVGIGESGYETEGTIFTVLAHDCDLPKSGDFSLTQQNDLILVDEDSNLIFAMHDQVIVVDAEKELTEEKLGAAFAVDSETTAVFCEVVEGSYYFVNLQTGKPMTKVCTCFTNAAFEVNKGDHRWKVEPC